MSARAGAEKPEQPLRLSCSRFGFLDRELRKRQDNNKIKYHPTEYITERTTGAHMLIHTIYMLRLFKLPFFHLIKHDVT